MEQVSTDKEISIEELQYIVERFDYITVSWECPKCGNTLTYDLTIEELYWYTFCGLCEAQQEWADVFISEIRMY